MIWDLAAVSSYVMTRVGDKETMEGNAMRASQSSGLLAAAGGSSRTYLIDLVCASETMSFRMAIHNSSVTRRTVRSIVRMRRGNESKGELRY